MQNRFAFGLLTFASVFSFSVAQTIWVPGGSVGNITGSHVGIGTTTPQQKLDVIGSIRSQGIQLLGTGQLQVQWWNSADGVDQKFTELIQTNGQFTGRFVNDSYTEADHWLLVKRNVGTYTTNSVNFPSGNVGIGTTSPSHKLAVNGTIRAKEVIIDTGWADYVFAADYDLAPLSEVEAHIKKNGHLPDVPSAADIAADGVSLGEMQSLLMAKVEELTLHTIRQEKQIQELRQLNQVLTN